MNFHGKSKLDLKIWMMDYDATHHMTSLENSFASLGSSPMSWIEVGDSSFIYVKVKGDILLDGGHINDVHFIPNIIINLLFEYQICNSCTRRTIFFTP